MREVLKETADGKTDKLKQLRISFEGNNPLSWGTKAETGTETEMYQLPLFLKVEKFKEGTRQMTGVFVTYTELLLQLTSPELLPKETFDQRATDLNGNVYDAVSTISGEPANPKQVAFFSTVAVAAVESYLESRRKSKLIEALNDNQTFIEKFAGHMQKGSINAAQLLQQEYDEKAQDYLRMAVSETTRREAIQNLISLDRRFLEEISTFHSMYQAFGQIPNAHRELLKTVKNPERKLSSIITLLEEGKRLESNYNKSLASNKAKAAQAIADKAMAQADMLEAEADAAQLRASSVKVKAVKARSEADEDSSNAEKKSRAEDLEKTAQELQEEADRKKTRTKEAQEAADEAQKQANEIKKKLLGVES